MAVSPDRRHGCRPTRRALNGRMPPRDEHGSGRLLATIAAGIVALAGCASQRDGTRKPRELAAEPGDSAKERLYFIDGTAGRRLMYKDLIA